MTEQPQLRLLSLDGGGVRGLSTLIVLQHLMQLVAEDSKKPPKPCDYFDLIGGTSTGGLLAILLGRLKLDIETCITAYLELSEVVFQPTRARLNFFSRASDTWNVRGRFSSEKLTATIKNVIKNVAKEDEEAELLEEPDPRCRVFVCALRGDVSTLAKFRSFSSRDVNEGRCKIWEAGRATSAASSFFDPISIGPYGETYVDGATGYNNPVNEVLEEARAIWPDADARIRCLISIGTGEPGVKPFGVRAPDVAKTIVKLATQTKASAEAFRKSHRQTLRGRYFRFNVEHGLENIGLDEYAQKAGIAAATKSYLLEGAVSDSVDECVQVLKGPSIDLEPTPVSPEEYQCIASFERCPDSDPLAYMADIPKPILGTFDWIFQQNEFKDWTQLGKSGVLHIFGKPGCGKTVLSKHAFQYIKDCNGSHSNVLYYGFKGATTRRTVTSMITSLIFQLLRAQPAIVKDLVGYRRSWKEPADAMPESQLLRLLAAALDSPHRRDLTCIIDGFDECSGSRTAFCNYLHDILRRNRDHPSTKFLIVSRTQDTTLLESSDPTQVDLDQSIDLDADIHRFTEVMVSYLVQRRKHYTYFQATIITALAARAQGMYILVELLIEELADNTDSTLETIHTLLLSLPRGLHSTYQQIWDRVKIKDRDRAALILSLILAASRPFKTEEFAIIVANASAEDGQGSSESKDIVGDLKRMFGPLLRITDVIQTAHPTVKEYFSRCHGEMDPPNKLSVDLPKIHSTLASLCLRYLESRDTNLQASLTSSSTSEILLWEDRHQGTLEEWPLFEYASHHWEYHLIHADPSSSKALLSELNRFFRLPHQTRLFWDFYALHERPSFSRLSEDDLPDNLRNSCNVELLEPASSLACMNDIPWLLEECMHDSISHGKLTYINLFGHTYECFLFQASRCLRVLARTFARLQPSASCNAQAMLHAASLCANFTEIITFIPGVDKIKHNVPLGQGSVESLYVAAELLLQNKMPAVVTPRQMCFWLEDEELYNTIICFNIALATYGVGSSCSDLLDGDSEVLLDVMEKQFIGATALLLTADRLPWTRHRDGKNILHLAAECLNPTLLALVLDSKHAVKRRSKLLEGRTTFDQGTPLHAACWASPTDLQLFSGRVFRSTIIKTLLEVGANPLARDSNGDTPLHLLSRQITPLLPDGSKTLGISTTSQDLITCISLLITGEHAELTTPDSEGTIILNLAAFHWPFEAIEKLVARLPDQQDLSYVRDAHGRTPLHYAAARGLSGTRKVICFFLTLGCDPRAEDYFHRTPLYYAVRYGRLSAVEELLACVPTGTNLRYEHAVESEEEKYQLLDEKEAQWYLHFLDDDQTWDIENGLSSLCNDLHLSLDTCLPAYEAQRWSEHLFGQATMDENESCRQANDGSLSENGRQSEGASVYDPELFDLLQSLWKEWWQPDFRDSLMCQKIRRHVIHVAGLLEDDKRLALNCTDDLSDFYVSSPPSPSNTTGLSTPSISHQFSENFALGAGFEQLFIYLQASRTILANISRRCNLLFSLRKQTVPLSEVPENERGLRWRDILVFYLFGYSQLDFATKVGSDPFMGRTY